MYHFKITIDKTKVSGTHTNFPLLFSQDCSSIPAGFRAHVVDTVTGLDIRFFDTDGVTELKREIVVFDSGGTVEAWVQIPSISNATNKEIWCQYGGPTVANSTGVWSDIYASAIYHLNNNVLDSTINAYNGSDAFTSDTAGQINRGRYFDGTDIIGLPDIPLGSIFSVSLWMKSSNSSGVIKNLFSKGHQIAPYQQFAINYDYSVSGDDLARVSVLDGVNTVTLLSSTIVTDNVWHHIAVTRSGTAFTLYIDGQPEDSATSAMSTDYDNYVYLNLGDWVGGVSYHIGSMDEVGIFSQELSSSLVLTKFNNQNDPATFESAGAEIDMSLVANFSGTPTSGNAPLSVAFTDTSTGSPTSWDWDFGDGSSHGTTQNPTHIYSVAGVYSVILSINGGVSTKTITDYITVNVVAEFSGSPTSGIVPLSVAFMDSSTGVPTSWYWQFGDGGTSSDQNPVHIYTNLGLYTVSLRASKGISISDEIKPNYITVTSVPPVADFTADQTSGDYPLVVQFTDTSTCPHAIVGWAWNFGDGYTSTEQNPVHTYNVAGTYTVILTVTNEYSQSDTETKTDYITVSNMFLLVDFVGVPRQGTSPLIVDFTNQTTLPPGYTSVTWEWNFGDGYTSVERDPTHMYLSGGSFTVTLKAFVQL